MTMFRTVLLFAMFLVGVGLTSALPFCTYPDPSQGTCNDGSGAHNVTCRMIAQVPGADPLTGYIERSYYWCDTNTVCSSDETQYQKKLRTKQYSVNGNSSGTCSTFWTVISVTDSNVGCCKCTMPAPPEW